MALENLERLLTFFSQTGFNMIAITDHVVNGDSSIVLILEPHDIVFTEVSAYLNLKDFDVLGSHILNAVHGMSRDKDALVGTCEDFSIMDGNVRKPFDDGPLFRPVAMLLETRTFAGKNH